MKNNLFSNFPTIQENVDLKPFCTFGVGGRAKWLKEVQTSEELIALVRHTAKEKIPYITLGKGSNCLFSDEGFAGLVIVNKCMDYEQIGSSQFRVGAGFSFPRLGFKTASQGLSGLEFAAGIPATVGGAIFMNAGAQKQETADCLVEVEWLSPEGEIHTFKREELQFSYRYSSFQKLGGVILAATFNCKPDPEARARQIELVTYRQKTQPYGDKSAGCVFRNPTGHSAGQLIDQLGLKGLQKGGAQVSPMHANFIVNHDQATSEDVKSLIVHIQESVKKAFDVDLETEIRFIS